MMSKASMFIKMGHLSILKATFLIRMATMNSEVTTTVKIGMCVLHPRIDEASKNITSVSLVKNVSHGSTRVKRVRTLVRRSETTQPTVILSEKTIAITRVKKGRERGENKQKQNTKVINNTLIKSHMMSEVVEEEVEVKEELIEVGLIYVKQEKMVTSLVMLETRKTKKKKVLNSGINTTNNKTRQPLLLLKNLISLISRLSKGEVRLKPKNPRSFRNRIGQEAQVIKQVEALCLVVLTLVVALLLHKHSHKITLIVGEMRQIN